MNAATQRRRAFGLATAVLLCVCAFITGRIGAEPTTQPTLDQKCQAALSQWQDRIDSEKLATLISPPFVLVGDENLPTLKQHLQYTIQNSADALWSMYFKNRPTEPIVIFLFSTSDKYVRLSKDWFNESDPPHFGYCRHDGVMVMNISTGGGTLVHELVHALLKYDFPNVPTWFNEGLASLYEQCQFDDGKIQGLKNWRLPALKKAIGENKLRSFKEMMDDPDFYDKDRAGLNYAQARYLMMYLQERGLLTSFYQSFKAEIATDPTGIETLHKIISPRNFADFEASWRKWVAGL